MKTTSNIPVIHGHLTRNATTAHTVDSSFGTSKGTKKVQRLVLNTSAHKGHRRLLDNLPITSMVDKSGWIATAEKVSWFQKFFHIECIIRDVNGDSQKVWVNKNSLKKRLSSSFQQTHLLWELLPKAAKKIDPSEEFNTRRKSPSHLSHASPSKGPLPREVLIPIIQQATKHQLKKTDIENILNYVEKNPQSSTQLVKRQISKCARTLLLGPNNQNYLLLTRAKSKNDPVLGKGSFKKAKIAIDLSTGQIFAVTVSKIKEDHEVVSSDAEIGAHKMLKDSLNVVQLHSSHITSREAKGKKSYMVLDYCNQGDLNHIRNGNKTTWNEKQKLSIALDIANGLFAVHKKKYLHRDVKPENVFVHTEKTKDHGTILRAKVADLGLACPMEMGEKATLSGTPNYFSPEKMKAAMKGSSHATTLDDIWALGLIFYSLFDRPEKSTSSFTPKFLERDDVLYFIKGLSQETVDNLIDTTQNTSREMKDLLKKMLSVNPHTRCSMEYLIKILEEMDKNPLSRKLSQLESVALATADGN